jgi:hypothetical protein
MKKSIARMAVIPRRLLRRLEVAKQGVHVTPESPFRLKRNWRSLSIGIGVRIGSESAFRMSRIFHFAWQLRIHDFLGYCATVSGMYGDC